MTFRLDIGIVGECLFVPDPAIHTMHVLLPVVRATGASDAFVAALCFDPACQQAHSPNLTQGVAMLPLQRVSLALGTRRRPIDLSIPPEVAPVGAVAGTPLVPGLFGNTPPDTLTARVDLLSGGISILGDGARWTYDRECERYTNSLLWQTEMDGDHLDLEFSAFPGPGGFRYTLYPVGGVLQLNLYSTPVSDLPPWVPSGEGPPPFDTPLQTFEVYYQMFEQPVQADPVPTFCATAAADGDDDRRPQPPRFAAGPYTCMVAQASLPG